MTTWRPGDEVALREILYGAVWAARPFRVIVDDADLTALYIAPGTVWKRPGAADGSLPALNARTWELRDRAWHGHGALQLVPSGAAHAWVAMWAGPERRLDHWYVNFQEPLRRTAIGFDTLDLVIDLVVSPDLSAWRWKDEADFEEAQRCGRVSATSAAAVRREAALVVDVGSAAMPSLRPRLGNVVAEPGLAAARARTWLAGSAERDVAIPW